MSKIRLQKFLADNGIASRRKCEELIKNGEITINGRVATIGSKINIEDDIVEYNGRVIRNDNKEYTYILLNKPIDYITTAKDQFRKKDST